MIRQAGIRLTGLLMAVLLCLSLLPAPARADEYDPNTPEKLQPDHLTATSAILIEADSGNVIFEKNAKMRAYPASTTKIMTVWLALELVNNDPEKLQQKYLVSASAVDLAEDESSAKLKAWEEVRLIDLLYAAILPSGNDAAKAIAENMGGTYSFVSMMNQKAAALGCTGTNFTNPHGLHDENHYTTAEDMALIAQAAMKNPIFQEIIVARSHVMTDRPRTIENRNDFLNPNKVDRYYAWGTGIKTGTTSAAGNCFVGSAEKDGVKLISVVFNSSKDLTRYTDTIKLMEYGYSQYLSTSIAELYMENPRVVEVLRFDLDDPEVGRLELHLQSTPSSGSDSIVTTLAQKEYWLKNMRSLTVTEFTRELTAPITAGEVMGTLTYYPPEGGVPVIYELIASRSIDARQSLAPSIDEIIAQAENDPNPFPRITFELVFVHLILPAAGVWAFIRLVKFLLKKRKHRHKMKTFKPTTRYFR